MATPNDITLLKKRANLLEEVCRAACIRCFARMETKPLIQYFTINSFSIIIDAPSCLVLSTISSFHIFILDELEMILYCLPALAHTTRGNILINEHLCYFFGGS